MIGWGNWLKSLFFFKTSNFESLSWGSLSKFARYLAVNSTGIDVWIVSLTVTA